MVCSQGIYFAEQCACGSLSGSGAGGKSEGVKDHLALVPKVTPGGAAQQSQ